MSDDYPDIGNLFGQDYSDPLGFDEYLRKQQEEENRRKAEEARLAKEQESDRSFMGDILKSGEDLFTNTFDPNVGVLGRPASGLLRTGAGLLSQMDPVLESRKITDNLLFALTKSPEAYARTLANDKEAADRQKFLDDVLGKGLGTKMITEPVQQMAREATGAKGSLPELVKAAFAPNVSPGDIPENVQDVTMTPQGPIYKSRPSTSEDVKTMMGGSKFLGESAESLGGLLEQAPELLMLPQAPALGALFLPGAAESLGSNIGTGQYGKAAIDAMFTGLLGKGLKDVVAPRPFTEVNTKPNPSEPVRDMTTAAPKDMIESITDLVPSPHEVQAKATFSDYIDNIKSEVARVTGQEHIANAKVEYIPGLKDGARYNPETNALEIDPSLLLKESPDRLAEVGFHELSHGGEEARHQFGNIEYTGEMVPGPKGFPVAEAVNRIEIGKLPPEEGLPTPDTYEIDAGELGLTPKELDAAGNYVETRPEIQQHFTPYMQERASAFAPNEVSFMDAFESAKNNPATVEIGQKFAKDIHDIQRAARTIELAKIGEKPAKSYEENLADIRAGRETSAPNDLVFPEQLRRQIDVNKKQLEAAERQGNTEKADELRMDIADKESLLAAKEAEIANVPEKGETQLKAEEAARKHEEEIAAFKAKKGTNEPVNQVTETTPVPKKLTADQIIENAVKASKSEPVSEAPRLVPKAESEGVISTPANIFRKVLQETKLTRFNVSRIKDELKAKGIELPAEIEKAIPELVKELKAKGWVQEKLGGTYTLLAGAGKAPKKAAPNADIVEQIKQTIDATGPAKKSPEEIADIFDKAQDTAAQIVDTKPVPTEAAPKEVPTGKVPNLTETMKAKLTPEELSAIGKLFGGTVKKKGTKELPEEVVLAQKAAIKGLAEKETKKAEGKEPSIPEELGEVSEGEGKQKPFEVTLNDGSTHIVRASTPEEARFNAEKVLEEYSSTKTVDKVEEHLGTLERAAKFEIEPVKTGSEAVSEALKETKKSATEEVKETSRLGREEEQLRKAQAKEKFKKESFNVALSNGRTVVVKARNEAKAREIAESRIKKMGSGVTVESVGKRLSALEYAITGGARKLEESGFLNNPVVKLLNSVKSIAFGGDVGHLLRQGKQMNADLLFSKHASKVLEQFPVIFKSAKSKEFFDNFNEGLYSDPLIKKMVDDFGLDMPGMGAHYKEEAFHGAGLAEKAPIIGKYFAQPSERAYTSGLNFLRAAQVKKWAETLEKDGFTPDNAPEKYHAVARAVNIISQRGHFQPAYQKLFSDASAIYGAPRAKAARLQNAAELFRGGTSGRVVRQTAAKTLAFNAGLFGLLKATLGATFVTDSESSDYGKIRVSPKITVDPWVGLGVTARTVAKIVHGKAKSPYTGKEYPVTPSDAIMGEFLGGIAPGVKLAWESMSGKDLRGYQVERLDSLLNVTPLTARSIADLLKEGDIDEAILLSILQAGGEGVDVFDYEKEKAKQQRLREERGIGSRKRRVTFPF